MSIETRTLKVLIAQARLNTQLVIALGVLGKKANLGSEVDAFMKSLQAAADHSTEVVEALASAVNELEGSSDG